MVRGGKEAYPAFRPETASAFREACTGRDKARRHDGRRQAEGTVGAPARNPWRGRHRRRPLLSRGTRAHGRLARPHRPHHQLGDHRGRGPAFRVAFDGFRPSRRPSVRDASRLPAFDDRGPALPLFRCLPLPGAADGAALFRADILAHGELFGELDANSRPELARAEILHFLRRRAIAPPVPPDRSAVWVRRRASGTG